MTVDNCLTVTTQFTDDELLAIPDLQTIVMAVNDAGTGVAQTGGQQEECDTTDNLLLFPASPCRIPQDTVTADICLHDSYSDENFEISADEIASAGTFHFKRVFEVDGCDSVIVLRLQVHPHDDMHFTETISEGNAYDNHGIFLSESVLDGVSRIDTAITFQSVYGCDSTVHVTVLIAVADIVLHLPNVITPSKSDGLNDLLSIPEKVQSQMADFEIRIFNRWGEQVFYSTDKNFQWDGNFKGKTYYNNVYQYVIRYSNLFGKSFVKKGTVTVL